MSESDAPAPAPPAPAAPATGAGKGVLYIAVAKLYFMVVGAVIDFRLTAILSRAVFGAYGVVASVIPSFNNVMVTGSIQAVSRFTAHKLVAKVTRYPRGGIQCGIHEKVTCKVTT